MDSWESLLAGASGGDRRAVSRLISRVEAREPGWQAAMESLYARSTPPVVIGITGAPGTGKSTVTGRLASVFSERGLAVAILAVDPSSPYSGGAVLGDRLRMPDLDRHGVLLRSMASRGASGGLARSAADVIRILGAAGRTLVLVETVGIGQVDIDVARLADVTAVMCIPGQGDRVQAIKAGLLEAASILVVNKADRDGAEGVVADLQTMLRVTTGAASRAILRTVATLGTGVPELADALLAGLEAGRARRDAREALTREVRELVDVDLLQSFWTGGGGEQALASLIARAEPSTLNPYRIYRALLAARPLPAVLPCSAE